MILESVGNVVHPEEHLWSDTDASGSSQRCLIPRHQTYPTTCSWSSACAAITPEPQSVSTALDEQDSPKSRSYR